MKPLWLSRLAEHLEGAALGSPATARKPAAAVTSFVDLLQGAQQSQPDYLALNPDRRARRLLVDGELHAVGSPNAILQYLGSARAATPLWPERRQGAAPTSPAGNAGSSRIGARRPAGPLDLREPGQEVRRGARRRPTRPRSPRPPRPSTRKPRCSTRISPSTNIWSTIR